MDADGYKQSPKRPRPLVSHWAHTAFGDYPCDSELAVLKRAICQRWPVTLELRAAVVDHLGELLRSGGEIAIGAATISIRAEKQNQIDESEPYRESVNLAKMLAAAEPEKPDLTYLE